MSMSDLKHSLRKYEFPQCAKEALLRIEQLLAGRAAPNSKQVDVAMEIISEFIFCESTRRGERRGLNPLQELQLIDVICEYLSSCTNETTKNTIFLSLFGGGDTQKRLKILSILASMAVSASSTPVLLAVGVWLQQMGCSSPPSLQLVENIIRDHFHLNTFNQTALKSLASSAPQFVANFITAVTELYMQEVNGVRKLPPKNLLEVITSWVYSNPTLCLSAQNNPPQLPPGSIPMAAVTPLAGLVHWCTLAPLYIDTDSEMVEVSPPKKIKIEGENLALIKPVPTKVLTESELYIKLHLGVLHSLRGRRGLGGGGAGGAVHAAALAAPAPALQAHAAGQARPQSDAKLQDCLDRLGQAVQVALSSDCVYGNINHLLATLDSLPENRLLRIVVQAHRSLC
ncbi:integrator complex subunit 15 [Cydia fagiglandana]|uniref:integrator complex subunit 15 n=1 Tax=Cydia fagiglandana TaxID=1458189 RepID=UPI002FEE0762